MSPTSPVPACVPRSPEHRNGVIDALKLETNARYQPEVVGNAGRRTKCNWAAEDFCVAMDAYLPKGLLALGQAVWLDSHAARQRGWFEVDLKQGGEYAEKGCPVLVCWINPVPGVSSHIAILRSTGRIAQAGGKNFNDGPITKGFGNRAVKCYVHL